MKFNVFVVAAALLAACGIPESTLLNEMESSDWEKVCSRVAEEQAAESIECDGYTIETEAMTKDEHEAACNDAWGDTSTWTDCTATFGDWIDYQEWEPADPCDPGDLPAAAEAVVTCFMDSMM